MTFEAGLPSTIEGVAHAFRTRQLTSEHVTVRCLDAIACHNPRLNAFIDVYVDEALAAARLADVELAAGHDRGPLHGVPIALKDLIDIAGRRTTAGSKVRERHHAADDAPIVTRLRAAGAVMVGKNNLHEFALGTTNEDSGFGPARHPRDIARSPGGSSGGSAAAVASGMAYAAVGTDTGGSIRIPAAICGLVGLKPAFGEIPLTGVVPLSSTLDHAGPIARTVADTRVLFDTLRGQTARPPRDIELRGSRIGLLRGYFEEILDRDVARLFNSACARLRDAGVTFVDASIHHANEIAAAYTRLVLTEAAAYHAPMLERQPGDYTPNVRSRLEMGRQISAEDYAAALETQEVLRTEVDQALAGCDALLLPTVPVPAPLLGIESIRVGTRDEAVRAVMLRLTQLFNITRHPAITLPCGDTPAGFPAGVQLAGPVGATHALLDLAAAVERHLGPGTSR